MANGGQHVRHFPQSEWQLWLTTWEYIGGVGNVATKAVCRAERKQEGPLDVGGASTCVE